MSLIEALAALAVMAFGLLAVSGMQSTLRSNSDVSKQRAEAVRMAQETMEDARAFESIDGAGATYEGIGNVGPETVTSVTTSNTTFSRTRTIVQYADAASAPPLRALKAMTVTVDWADRTGETFTVRLATAVAGVAPELAGSLGLAGDRAPIQLPRGRHGAIPVAAVDQGNGTSEFRPPGAASGVNWVFNNQDGFIVRICLPACSDTRLLPLSGFVRFADGNPAAQAEVPVGMRLDVNVQVNTTMPETSTVACYSELLTDSVAYYCAMPLTTAAPRAWSGRTVLALPGVIISDTLGDTSQESRKICRYTPQQSHTPTDGNAAHPLDYSVVSTPLANQNFLVIASGSGTTPYACPLDDTSTPLVNGNTYRHQPLT